MISEFWKRKESKKQCDRRGESKGSGPCESQKRSSYR